MLVVLSLRPGSALEEHVDRAAFGARVLGELVAPFAWLSARRVRAAEASIEEDAQVQREKSSALLAGERSAAQPTVPWLLSGRGFIHAEVVERRRDNLDELVIQFHPGAALEVGMPVVCGNVYVGRVSAIDRAKGEASVALVTGAGFRVGGIIPSEAGGPIASEASVSIGENAPSAAVSLTAAPSSSSSSSTLVVGGLARSPVGDREALYLAAQVPSLRSIRSGTVSVFEPDEVDVEPYRKLADGFLLGELSRYLVDGVPVLGVRALLDYRSGPYQVVALTRPERVEAGPLASRDPFDESCWVDGAFVLSGDPSFWREGRKLDLGRVHRIGDKAAVSAGGRFLGRVAHAGLFTSEVSLLGDPGLALSALVKVGDSGDEFVLGRLVSLGRDPSDGAVLMRWEAMTSTTAASGIAQRAALFTGSGERDVPPGLFIGTADIPASAGARGSITLRVVVGESAIPVRHVRAWRGRTRDLTRGEVP